ncbi:hypothetical protein LTS09_003751 [Friedmanniomyces endolithicus]|nr:hypothetical protein LTS09_003751 [Friedmanniomyces endolithicus]
MWRVKQLFCGEWRALLVTPGAPRGVRTASSATSAFTSPGRAPIKYGNWSPAEDDLIVQLRASGHTVPAIAERLSSRSMGAVSNRIYEVLGPQGRVKVAPPGRPFSAEDDEFLAKVSGFPSPSLLSRFPDRSLVSLYKRMQRLRRPAGRANFTPEDDAELCKLRDQDHLTWDEIAARMPSCHKETLAKRYVRITPLSARTHVRLRRDRDGTASSEIRRLRDSGLTSCEDVSLLEAEGSHYVLAHSSDRYDGTASSRQNCNLARSIAGENAELVRLRALKVPWREIIKSFPGRELGYLHSRLEKLQMRLRKSNKPKTSGSLVDQPVTKPSQQNTVQP